MHSLGKGHIPGLGGSKSWHSELLLGRRRGANVENNSWSQVNSHRLHSLNRLFSWACIVYFNDLRRRWLGLWGAGPPTSATMTSMTSMTTPYNMIHASIQWWECYVKVPGRLGGTSLGWRAGVLSVTQSVSNPQWWHQRDLPRHGSSNSSRYQQMIKLGIQHSGECQCIISQLYIVDQIRACDCFSAHSAFLTHPHWSCSVSWETQSVSIALALQIHTTDEKPSD